MNIKKICIIFLIFCTLILSISAISANDDILTGSEDINTNQAVEVEKIEKQDTKIISANETSQASNYNPQNINDEDPKYTEVKLTTKPLKTTYKSTDTLKVKVSSKYGITYGVKDGMSLKDSLVTLKIKVNGKWKTYQKFANAKGVAKFKLTSLPVGKYTVKMYCNDQNFHSSTYKTTLTITKAKPKVTANVAVKEYYKKGSFKIVVKDKNKNPINGIKLKVKVYTGKKAKTYNLKTNKKGIATISTKKMRIGHHKVVIKNGDKNSKISKKSEILIGIKKVRTLKMNKQVDFNNGDYFLPYVEKIGQQDEKGVYVDNRRIYDGSLDGAASHHIIKAKYYFKNTKTGAIKTKISTDNHMMHTDLIDGYAPIKVKVWYIQT